MDKFYKVDEEIEILYEKIEIIKEKLAAFRRLKNIKRLQGEWDE